jgi:hypothetical protein
MRGSITFLLLLTAAPGSAAAQALSQIPTGPIKVIEMYPPVSLSAITLGPETTRKQLAEHWGDGLQTMSSFVTYRVDTGATLELLFSPIAPYGLVRARLLDGKTEGGTLLFDDNRRARSRRIAQIAKCPGSVAYLRKVWGPADYEYGSGIGRYVYELADGSSVTVSDMSRGC